MSQRLHNSFGWRYWKERERRIRFGYRAIASLKAATVVLILVLLFLLSCTANYVPVMPEVIPSTIDAPSLPVSVLEDHFRGAPKMVVAPIGTTRTVTAYSSRPEETDDTPCVSADGSDICRRHELGETLCAANFVPLGTILAVEEVGTCVVSDRMNRKYSDRVDLYFGKDTAAAREFGVQKLTISIVQ